MYMHQCTWFVSSAAAEEEEEKQFDSGSVEYTSHIPIAFLKVGKTINMHAMLLNVTKLFNPISSRNSGLCVDYNGAAENVSEYRSRNR